MSRIVNVHGSDDYKLFIDFEDGSSITYNMQKQVKTIPYYRLSDIACFKSVEFDDKSVYWSAADEKPEFFPLRLGIDAILFSLRG